MGEEMKPINGTCHCGAVTFKVTTAPEFMVSCNCSICRRLAPLWVHSPPAETTINAPDGGTNVYMWGDRGIMFHSCATCGCTTHWTGVIGDRMAVNMRLADPGDIKNIPVRHWDGADTWDWID